MRLGVIGATGGVGTALGTRALAGGTWRANDMVLLNRVAPRTAYDPWPDVTWARDAADLCTQSDVITLATRPEDFPLAGFDGSGKLILSFMTSWSLERLAARCPGARIIRVTPSGAASEGRSFTPWVAGPGVTATDIAVLRPLLRVIGEEAEVADEAALDYLSAVSGTGAAYPALMARAMLADAKARGLSAEVAERAVASILAAVAALAADPARIEPMLQTYMGYRGITAAGLVAADAAGFSHAVAAALAAGNAKARDLTLRGLDG